MVKFFGINKEREICLPNKDVKEQLSLPSVKYL